jgi:hypothetical protein
LLVCFDFRRVIRDGAILVGDEKPMMDKFVMT